MKQYNWLTRNAKMRKSSGIPIFNWGIPAFRAKDGFKTCPKAGVCASGCYATQGAYVWSNVSKVFELRLDLSKSDKFIDTIRDELRRRDIKKVRIHDSGDFYNHEYYLKWYEIMRTNSNIQFYAYTKMISYFKGLNKSYIPDNFTLIYSYGGLEDNLINPDTDRHSRVFTSQKELKELGYIDATNDDNIAINKVNHRIGLVYHGAPKKDWSKKGTFKIKETDDNPFKDILTPTFKPINNT